MVETIPINRISTEGTQARAELNQIIIGEYAEAYEQGAELPPIDVYFDQETYWLADGFHRLRAVEHIGRDSISAKIYPGGQREAILHAVGANETHGWRRTNADRRNAVRILLTDPEWSAWANTEIASKCNVSEFLVRTIRRELTPAATKRATETKRKVRRGGQTFEQNVTRIGKRRPQQRTAVTMQQDAGQQPHDALSSQVPPLSSIKSKMDDNALDVESAQELAPSPAPDAPAATVEPEAPIEEPTGAPPAPVFTVEREVGSAELVTAVAQEPPSVSDVPPESLPTAEFEPGPAQSMPDAITTGRRITVDLDSSAAPPVEVLNWLTLAVRWDYATRVEQEAFVAEHHDELRTMLAKLDRQKAAAS